MIDVSMSLFQKKKWTTARPINIRNFKERKIGNAAVKISKLKMLFSVGFSYKVTLPRGA